MKSHGKHLFVFVLNTSQCNCYYHSLQLYVRLSRFSWPPQSVSDKCWIDHNSWILKISKLAGSDGAVTGRCVDLSLSLSGWLPPASRLLGFLWSLLKNSDCGTFKNNIKWGINWVHLQSGLVREGVRGGYRSRLEMRAFTFRQVFKNLLELSLPWRLPYKSCRKTCKSRPHGLKSVFT